MPIRNDQRDLVALDIRVIRDVGVQRVSIFSQGRRLEGFTFYQELLPTIARLSKVAQRIHPNR